VAGILLSQIMYWHLPPKKGGPHRMCVHGCAAWKEDRWWLVKKRTEWHKECRLSPKQFDRASDVLVEKGFITIRRFHFHHLRMIHIHLNVEMLMQFFENTMEPGTSKLTFGELASLPSGNLQVDVSGTCINDSEKEETFGETEKERKDPSPTSPVVREHFSLFFGPGNTTTPVPVSLPQTTWPVPDQAQCDLNLDGVRGLMARLARDDLAPPPDPPPDHGPAP
jgi:hypothetical protein